MQSVNYGISAHYEDDRGRAYFEHQNSDGIVHGELEAHKFSRYIPPAQTILDFGCGGGNLLRALSCTRKIGIEPNPHAREHAASLGIECYASLDGVASQTADVAISNHALEHVPSPIEALRQLRDKIVWGGVAVICVPMEDWRSHRKFDPSDVDHHLYTWNPQLLGNTLLEAGFTVGPENLGILTHAWPPRFCSLLYRTLPITVFDMLCKLTASALRRRQLVAVLSV